MILPDALKAIVETCRDIGAWLISDEIYHRLVWTGDDVSALAFDDDVIVLNSFSKYYSMTGWRIGWLVLPERLVRPVERLAQNLFISTPELAQRAAIHAFSPEATEELDRVKAVYAANRARLLSALPAIGFTDVLPMDGAFYAYADASRFTNDSLAFANRMLDETGVAATPGVDFDGARGHRYMRFSFAGTTADIDRAIAALKGWLA
jgi:aspartate/methionine/tyrosine aminotransferase